MKKKSTLKPVKWLGMLIALIIFTNSVSVAQVSGVVSGEGNSPLPGVSVVIKSTNKGTTTDQNGRYSIDAPGNSTLVFSFVGYKKTEFAVGNRNSLNVSLEVDAQALSEIVVVGYGSVKKSSLTAAVAQVSAKEISALPVVSVESALQGRVAGVIVTNNGSPGEAPIVRVRGIGSINYASNPLYVVDGYPVGSINDFDSRDVESIDVLKDASSAAIYGSRAANGVILVTTKKGSKDGKIHVNIDSYAGSQKAWKKLDVLNTQEYLQYGKALLGAAGAAFPDRWSQLDKETYPGSGVTFANTNVDMQDYMFQNGGMQQHTISLSGGNAKSRYYSSIGYFKQDGIFVGTNYGRRNVRLNSTHDISSVFTFGQTLTIAQGDKLDEQAGGGRSTLANVVKSVPYIPVYNPTEIGGFYGTTNADGSDPVNPVLFATLVRSQNRNTRLLATGFVEAKLTSFLKYKFTAGIDYNATRNKGRTPIYTAGQSGSPKNNLNDSRGEYLGKLFTNQITFDKTFGKHYVNVIGVAEQQFGLSEGTSTNGTYKTNKFDVVTSNTADQAVSGYKDEQTVISYLARLNYDFGGKYLLSASIRRDGSSIFAPGKKWGTFPAISAGWRISEESFMKDLTAVSELKLRGSYGLVGNISGFPNYAWQSVIGANTNYPFAGGLQAGQSTNQLGNAELGWELTKMTNVGVDLGLLRGKVTVSADYYIRETADNSLVLARELPSTLGYSNATIANLGAMKNSGFDLEVGYNQTQGDFKWSARGNVGTLKNEVLSLVAPIQRGNHGGESVATVTKTEVGKPVQYFYGYIVDRIYQNAEEVKGDNDAAKAKGFPNYQGGNAAPGDIRFKDITQDGQVTDADRTEIGNPWPDFTYGLNLSGEYKGFDMTVFFQGSQGNDLYNNAIYWNQGMTRLFGSTKDVLRAWTPSNTNTDIPRAINSDPNGNATRPSSRYVEDGSYLRLKNLSIGYSLPKSLLNNLTKGSVSNIRIYLSTNNLLTFTKYSGYDPEVGARSNNQLVYGVDDATYPQPRTILGGIQIGF